jgi:hypothetical protein
MTAIKTTAAIPKKYMMVSLMVMVTVLSLRGALDAFKTERPVSHYPAVGWAFLLLYCSRLPGLRGPHYQFRRCVVRNWALIQGRRVFLDRPTDLLIDLFRLFLVGLIERPNSLASGSMLAAASSFLSALIFCINISIPACAAPAVGF